MGSQKSERILLSEGSSLSARETVTALGMAGYSVDVCDPNPLCLARLSRFVRRYHRCPAIGADPTAYLDFILDRLGKEHYDVLLPVHEQAFLFARFREQLKPHTGLAIADFSAFLQLQGKVSCVRLLEQLGIPHPPSEVIRTERELRAFRPFPFFVKAEYGTAKSGVWRIGRAEDLNRVAVQLASRGLFDGQDALLVQAAALGALERVQAVFDAGRLIALHCYRQRLEGPRGGDAAKVSVHRPVVWEQVERLGQHLHWHGALSLDYFFEEDCGPSFIDANPRLVEPMNALFSGINLAEILVRISLGERVEQQPPGREGVRTHLSLMALLAAAIRSGSRAGVIRRMGDLLLRTGKFANSVEELTPIDIDPPSALPLSAVLTRLLLKPTAASVIAEEAISGYSLSSAAIHSIIDAKAA